MPILSRMQTNEVNPNANDSSRRVAQTVIVGLRGDFARIETNMQRYDAK